MYSKRKRSRSGAWNTETFVAPSTTGHASSTLVL
jgi:hypothetical protein